MVRWLENDELEAIMAYLEVRVGICLQGLKKPIKTPINMTGLQAKIWTQDLPNTKQECYPLTVTLGLLLLLLLL
jgi:hypothetical protein